MTYTLTSNDDDTVTLVCGSVRAEISAASWEEANQAAHLLASALTSKKDVDELARKVRRLHANIGETLTLVSGMDQRILDLVRDVNEDRTTWAKLRTKDADDLGGSRDA